MGVPLLVSCSISCLRLPAHHCVSAQLMHTGAMGGKHNRQHPTTPKGRTTRGSVRKKHLRFHAQNQYKGAVHPAAREMHHHRDAARPSMPRWQQRQRSADQRTREWPPDHLEVAHVVAPQRQPNTTCCHTRRRKQQTHKTHPPRRGAQDKHESCPFGLQPKTWIRARSPQNKTG